MSNELELELDDLELDEVEEAPAPKPVAKKAVAKRTTAAKPAPAATPVRKTVAKKTATPVAPKPELHELELEEDEAPSQKPAAKAVKASGPSGDFVKGYALGKHGAELDDKQAAQIGATLETAGLKLTDSLFGHLVSAFTGQSVETPAAVRAPKGAVAVKTSAPAPVKAKAAPVAKAVVGDDGVDVKRLRVWAQENYEGVGDRGRIPAEIREAYIEAGRP